MVGKLTLFELHMDSPRFGTNEYDDIEAEDTETQAVQSPEPVRSPRVGRLVVGSLAVAVAATLVARRFVGGPEEADIDIDGVDDETPIEVTQ